MLLRIKEKDINMSGKSNRAIKTLIYNIHTKNNRKIEVCEKFKDM